MKCLKAADRKSVEEATLSGQCSLACHSRHREESEVLGRNGITSQNLHTCFDGDRQPGCGSKRRQAAAVQSCASELYIRADRGGRNQVQSL